MAMEKCNICKNEFLTECDPYVLIPLNSGVEMNCGCWFERKSEKKLYPKLLSLCEYLTRHKLLNQNQLSVILEIRPEELKQLQKKWGVYL